MPPASQVRPAWAPGATLRAVWVTARESSEWIASHTNKLLIALGSTLDIPGWETPQGELWAGTLEALAEIVIKHVTVGTFGGPEPESGYRFTVSGTNQRLLLHVHISAGAKSRGRRVPLHTVSIDIRELMFGGVTSIVGDTVCAAVAETWNPLALSLSDLLVNRTARRGGWKIPVGYRTWFDAQVGTISQLEQGLTATELAGGTLISAPDDWPAEKVVAAMTSTLAASGLDEVPRQRIPSR